MKKFFLPLLLLAANFCIGQVNLNLGLRAYYPFSGNANDVSGNNNNPVFNNATLTADRFGNPNSAYHFNGIDKYMRIPDHATLNMGNTMSIALWVKPTGYNTGPCYTNMLVMKSSTATLQSNYHVRFGDIYNGCSLPNPAEERFAGNNAVAQTPFVQLNQWYSVVWTSDGVTEKIYVNCVLRESVPAGGIAYTNTFDLLFGMNVNPSFPYWLNGDLDEVRLYNRALNQDEVNTLGGCIVPVSCNNWLNTPGFSSYATIGDLDVSGNQMTIEATYNRTGAFNSGIYPGHLVSKHSNTTDDNYSLFPNGCAITTSTGYKSTFETCGLGLNKTYHVALVYDGSFLKFYRNGFLMTQVACTGNLITNNINATIAQYAGGAGSDEQFIGNVNEVRIWNVARTQAQIQTYMNSSLSNPTTITGLLGYYTFDNLQNKQGNAAFNATLVGPATINTTNTSCTFIADSCVVPVACNNWLRTQAVGQSVTVGDLDVSGNQLTIEGNFNCSAFPVGTGNIWEEIVSKHSGVSDCNYALRMNLGAITTTNGFFRTPNFPSASCDSNFLNKTYHAAMVYNGSTLKFYRNGFLMTQIPATGNLVLNNLLTTIGDYAFNNPQGTNFQGYLNEIRIWNVARTQAQIQTYMNSSIPNPTTQAGLLGYYTFDNLINKQGNAAWNGTLNGGATINNANPNCTFVADSCAVVTSCNNWLSTPAQPAFVSVGDLDITGNTLTIEATANRTSFLSNGTPTEGDLVSKHSGPANANYILRPTRALITTTNGFFFTPTVCDIDLNKTHHYAMVYNGTTLKFYRNGFLMSQVAASGNLIQNDLNTVIAWLAGQNLDENFVGYINEVRIWNVERTQAQIQANINSSLPNPTTQTGLLAYYTFDNLLNKQGNPAWNGTMGGGASINATNPNCTFVADSCVAVVSCNNWLNTPDIASYATVGDLDITGNQLTIEAICNPTVPVAPGATGYLVSKHTNAFDDNYVLWSNGCALTTTTHPQVLLTSNCDVNFNKTYHLAMVYDGTTLKFYRNGFLHSQAPMSGNLVTNNFLTTIAQNPISGGPIYPFLGKMNEVRIWNVARTQAQLQTYMNSSLPNPTTTPGLLGYYTFDNLLNKQGNAAFNVTLHGGATINSNNPNCTFTADSCAVVTPAFTIINDYTPVLGFNPCDNKLTVENGTAYNVGDTVLLIQMKGAVIDSTNTAAFGTITDYKNAGNYEFNYVKTKTGNVIELSNTLTRQYDIPVGKVQLIRVPYYNNLTTSDVLTCLPWDGNKGGVLVFNVQNALTLNADMDVSGRGFTGGIDPVTVPGAFNCNENQFYYPVNPDLASGKGEGIADISAARSFGRGALANGGGGGNSHNSGGAGGGNISAGGFGGYQFESSPCNGTVPFDNRGISGKALTYSNAANKIFLGGGGGAGHTNNPEAFQANGGNGAGIIIVSAASLTSNTRKIIANGNEGSRCGATTSGCHEGMGGGGAAGAVLLQITNYLDNTAIESKGGKGADMTAAGLFKVGPVVAEVVGRFG